MKEKRTKVPRLTLTLTDSDGVVIERWHSTHDMDAILKLFEDAETSTQEILDRVATDELNGEAV